MVNASVEWSLKRQLNLEASPSDVAASPDGKLVYVLVPGKILVYSVTENKVIDFMPVGRSADKLTMGKDNSFIVTSSTEKTLKIYQAEIRHQIDISGLPFKGPEQAPVVIAVYSDYQCPYCARLGPLLQQVLEKYPKDVKLVYKNFPLDFHKIARKAASSVLAADEQGKFWDFHEKLFDNISALNDAKIQEIAKELKLNMERFNKKMQDPAVIELINRDVAEAQRIGVNSTPTVFVNGKPLKDRSLQGFQEMIEDELHR
jgi:protein-disulfide isomerase